MILHKIGGVVGGDRAVVFRVDCGYAIEHEDNRIVIYCTFLPLQLLIIEGSNGQLLCALFVL